MYYIALLVEHQSTPDRMMPFRVLQYLVGFLNTRLKSSGDKRLPAVYGLVFYHGERSPYPYSLKLQDCFDDPLGLMTTFFNQPTPLIDVSQLSDDELRRQNWVGPMTRALKHIRDQDIGDICLEILLDLDKQDLSTYSELEFTRGLLNYLLYAGNIDNIKQFLEGGQRLPSPIRGEFMTAAEKLQALGVEQGLEHGLEQGLGQGREAVALNLLRKGSDAAFVAGVTELDLALVLKLKSQLDEQ